MDAQDLIGNTPLHLSVENDAYDALDFLLSMYVLRYYLFYIEFYFTNENLYLHLTAASVQIF